MSTATIVIIVAALAVLAAVVVLVVVRTRRRRAQASARMGLPPLGVLSGDDTDKVRASNAADHQQEK